MSRSAELRMSIFITSLLQSCPIASIRFINYAFLSYGPLLVAHTTIPGVTLPPCRGLWGTLHIWGRY